MSLRALVNKMQQPLAGWIIAAGTEKYKHPVYINTANIRPRTPVKIPSPNQRNPVKSGNRFDTVFNSIFIRIRSCP